MEHLRWDRGEIPRLLWNLTGNLIGSYWMIIRMLPVTEEEAQEDQWH